MKVSFLKIIGNWRAVADAARTTVRKEAGEGEPSSSWKRRLILAEHSPIRKLKVEWKWADLLWWVQTHFTRHKFGVEWFVSTSRSDRTGINRDNLFQSAPVDVEAEANSQAIINISRKRLCNKASRETRDAWWAFLRELRRVEPELARCCVPDCVYRGWCYEMDSCGFHHKEGYRCWLNRYREGVNQQEGPGKVSV